MLVMRGHELGVMTREYRGDKGLNGVAFKYLFTSVSHFILVVTLLEYSHFTNGRTDLIRKTPVLKVE